MQLTNKWQDKARICLKEAHKLTSRPKKPTFKVLRRSIHPKNGSRAQIRWSGTTNRQANYWYLKKIKDPNREKEDDRRTAEWDIQFAC